MSPIDSQPQPMQILCLPDEILQKILGYCCSDEDLEFLLWSCPLMTTKDQFCHQCYHCTLCHGPFTYIPRMAPHPTRLHDGSQTQTVATTTSVTPTYTDCRVTATSVQPQQGPGRRRRRRLPGCLEVGSAMNCQDGHGDRGLYGLDLGHLSTGARRCPWNNDQRLGQRHESSRSGNDRTGVRPLSLVPPSRPWSFFGKTIAAAAAAAAGAMKSGRTIGAGNGDPVVYVPGVQGSMMNNNNRARVMIKAGMGSASGPAARYRGQHNATLLATAAPGTTYDPTCLSSREDENQHLRQAGVYSPPPHQHHHKRHCAGKGCMMGENHSDRLRPVPPARTKSLSLSPSSLASLSSADPKAAEATIASAGADAKHSYLVAPVPADTAGSSFSCRMGNLHGRFSTQASSQTFLSQEKQQQHVDQGPDPIGSSFIELSMPFQLLLVCKRFGNAIIQSLWDRVVFHGHDPVQVQALLYTLKVLEGVCSPSSVDPKLPDCSIAIDTSNMTNNSNHTGSSNFYFSSKGSSLTDLKSSRKVYHGDLPQFTTTRMTTTSLASALGPTPRSPNPTSFANLATRDEDVTDMDRSRPTLWAYSQLVQRVVLNFAHVQSSRSLLIETLECLRACRANPSSQGYRSLDLHANEKMRSSGGENTSPMDLDQLFGWGSGFSNLSYLRLRGGFVDNQLLNAITKGMQIRQQSLGGHRKSRLSQVLLGPGSFTDSAIEKLIDVAGSSLEVVIITSCVDIGGSSLARFLTRCPKLRVLGFYRSLTRDEDLFHGLGVCSEEKAEMTMESSSLSEPNTVPSTMSTPPPPILRQETRKVIVAPLERLELSTMVKMSSKAVAMIVQGVSQSLKHLTVDSKHFNEEFLEEIFTAPSSLANSGGMLRLESLSFKDGSINQKQQQQQHRPSSGVTAAHSPLSTDRPHQQRSPWLGDTTVNEWILHGGSPVDDYFHSAESSMEHSRALSLTPSVRMRDRVLTCLLRGRCLIDRVCGGQSVNPMTAYPSTEESQSYEGMLEKFAVQPVLVCRVVARLSKPTSFTVLGRNVVAEHEAWLRQKEEKESSAAAITAISTLLTTSGDASLLESEQIEDTKRWEGHLVGGDISLRVPEALASTMLTMIQVRWILILVAIAVWVSEVINNSDNGEMHGREDS